MRNGSLTLLLRVTVVSLLLALCAENGLAASCEDDNQCPDRQICVSGTCQLPRRFGLIYSHQPGPDGHRVLFPFYFHYWKPSGRTRVVFPLFFQRAESGEDAYSDLVVPLLLYQRRQEPGIDSHRVWPLFFYSHYTTPGNEGRRLGLLPLFFAQQRGPRTLVVLPPLLFGHSSNREQRTATTVAGPFYVAKRGDVWHGGLAPLIFVRKAEGATRVTLFPLLHVSTSPQSTLIMATPLFWHHHDADSSFTLGLPLAYYRKDHAHTDFGVPPIFFYARRQTARTWAVPLLLFGHSDDAQARTATTVAGPIFAAKRGDVWHGGVLPLLFLKRAPDSVRLTLFPLLHVSRWRADSAFLLMLTPLFWHYQSPARSVSLALPLLYQSINRDTGSRTVALPLLLFGHRTEAQGHWSTTIAGPLYVAKRGPIWYGGVAPLLHVRRDPASYRVTLFPLLHVSRTPSDLTVMATPLLWHHRDAHSHLTLGLPIFYDARGPGRRDVGVLPFFVYSRRENHLTWAIPALLTGHSEDLDRQHATTVVGPLYVAKRGTTYYSGLAPLLFVRKDPTSLRVTLFPLLHVTRSPQSTLVMATPLLWHHRDADSHFTLGLPIFYDAKGPDRRDLGVLPLFVYSRREEQVTWAVPALILGHHEDPQNEYATTVGGPIYIAKRGKTFYGGAVPLLFVRRDPTSTSVTLFPLLHVRHSRESTLVMATPLFWHHRDADSHFTMGLPIFYDAKGPDRRDLGALPLFVYSRREKHLTWAVPALLLGHSEDPNSRHATTVGGPIYVAKRDTTWYGGLAPLLFVRKDPSSVRVTLFPLLHVRHGADSTFVMATPLFWHRHDAVSHFTLGLPIFYDAKGLDRRDLGILPLFVYSRRETRLTWAVPALILGHSGDPENQHATTVAGPVYVAKRGATWYGGVVPFLFVRRSPTSIGVTLLPLLAVKRSPESTFVMATPLFWYHRDADSRFTLALPFFYDAKGPDYRELGVLPAFFYARRESRATWAVPLLILGHSEDRESQEATTVGGPFYVAKRGSTWYGGVVPFLFVRRSPESTRVTLLPLFIYSRREHQVTWTIPALLLGHSEDPDHQRATTIAGPLYVAKRGTAWHGGLVPLVFVRRDGEALRVITPLAGFGRTAEGFWMFAGPLYVRREPLYRTTAILPLFIDHVNQETSRRTTMLLPLFFRHATPEATTLVVPLLLTYLKLQPQSRSTEALFLPLFYYAASLERSTTILFPLFYHLRRPDYRATILAPLFIRYDSDAARTVVIPPLLTFIRLRKDGGRSAVVFPIFYHASSPGDRSSTTILFPLFYHLRRPTWRATIFFPLGAHWSTQSGHSTLVLNLYYFKGVGEKAGTWQLRFWPLFGVGHRPRPQDLEWSIFEGLIGYQRYGRYRTLRLFWIPIPLSNASSASP